MSQDVVEITDANFEGEILKSGTPALLDFWAPWCGPCRAIAPYVEQLAGEYRGRVKVGKLNVDDSPGVAQRYDIRSIPTLLIFKDGAVVGQLVGSASKSKIEEQVKKTL
ncbi:MAG TPA: thioredoxin [Polyangia bacterium]|jgi:thioredoxin 1